MGGLVGDEPIKAAWDNPFGPAGAAISAGLAAKGQVGGTQLGAAAVSSVLNNWFSSASQSLTAIPLEQRMTLILPNVYLVSIGAQMGGRAVVNVIGVRGSSAGQENAAAQAVRTAWKVSGGPLGSLPSVYNLVQFQAMDLSSATGGIYTQADTTAGTTTSEGASTAAASALIKWNGTSRSRSTRGRMYFGPLRESQINPDGRTLTSATISALNGCFTAFRNSLSSSGFTLCVVSRKTATAYDVTAHNCEATIATQRRRIRS